MKPDETKQNIAASGVAATKSPKKPRKIRDGEKPRAAKVKNGGKKLTNSHTVKDNRLEMLVTVVNRNKAEYFIDLMYAFDINIQIVTLGHGTADAKTLAYYGATDTDKAVIFGVVQANRIPELMAILEKKFKTIKNGNGIAYTVPLTGVIGTLIFGFLSNNRKTVKDVTENKK